MVTPPCPRDSAAWPRLSGRPFPRCGVPETARGFCSRFGDPPVDRRRRKLRCCLVMGLGDELWSDGPHPASAPPSPPPSGLRESGQQPEGEEPPPQAKVTLVGKREMCRWENMVGPVLVHELLGPRPPPPSPPSSPLIRPCPHPPPREGIKAARPPNPAICQTASLSLGWGASIAILTTKCMGYVRSPSGKLFPAVPGRSSHGPHAPLTCWRCDGRGADGALAVWSTRS